MKSNLTAEVPRDVYQEHFINYFRTINLKWQQQKPTYLVSSPFLPNLLHRGCFVSLHIIGIKHHSSTAATDHSASANGKAHTAPRTSVCRLHTFITPLSLECM